MLGPSEADAKAMIAEMKQIAAEMAKIDAKFAKILETLKTWL